MPILWDIDDGELVGSGGWHDGGTPLKYRVEPTGIIGDWQARFEGQILGHGQLKRVLDLCERHEPKQ